MKRSATIKILFVLILFLPIRVLADPVKNPEVPPQDPARGKAVANQDCIEQVTPQTRIKSSFFGLKNKDARDQDVFVPTKRVPLINDQTFGFKIDVDTTKDKVQWQYEYELPKPMPTWGQYVSGMSIKFFNDSKTALIDGIMYGPRGTIEEFWFMLPVDDAGPSHMTVYIDGMKACDFYFEVYKP